MGLDVGDKTIGVAVSDLLGFTAQGITTVKRESPEKDLQQLASLCSEYQVEKIIVGLPKNMNGTLGPQGEKAVDFMGVLREDLNIPVEPWDERLSTVSAQKVLIQGDVRRKKRKTVIDKMAAVLILQNYLDSLASR